MSLRRVVMLAFLATAISGVAFAQEHYTAGPVVRVVLLKVQPGKTMNDVLGQLRNDFKPLMEDYKSAGIIQDFEVFMNTTTVGEDDWDVGYRLVFKNYAALDDMFTKTDPILQKRVGSSDARQKRTLRLQEVAKVVSSRLVRSISLKEPTTTPGSSK